MNCLKAVSPHSGLTAWRCQRGLFPQRWPAGPVPSRPQRTDWLLSSAAHTPDCDNQWEVAVNIAVFSVCVCVFTCTCISDVVGTNAGRDDVKTGRLRVWVKLWRPFCTTSTFTFGPASIFWSHFSAWTGFRTSPHCSTDTCCCTSPVSQWTSLWRPQTGRRRPCVWSTRCVQRWQQRAALPVLSGLGGWRSRRSPAGTHRPTATPAGSTERYNLWRSGTTVNFNLP